METGTDTAAGQLGSGVVVRDRCRSGQDGSGACLPLGRSKPSSSSKAAAASERRARPPAMSARRRRARAAPCAAARHHPLSPDRPPRRRPPAALPPLYSDLLNTISFKFNSFMVFIYQTFFTTARRRPRVPSDPRASPTASRLGLSSYGVFLSIVV